MVRLANRATTTLALVLVLVASAGLLLSAAGCASVGTPGVSTIPVPSAIPTTDQERVIIEDGYKFVYTLYLVGSIQKEEWQQVKVAYDTYRQALIALKAHQEQLNSGQPVDLTPYAQAVSNALVRFWTEQSSVAARQVMKEVAGNGSK